MFRVTQLIVLASVVISSLAVVMPQRCGGGRSCIFGQSSCQSGRCVRQNPYVWGHTDFNCYRQNTVAAEMKNDPELTTFNNQTVPFQYPCRLLVTHVIQELKNKDKEVIGSCEFHVHAYNGKSLGKFYVFGFDVAVNITYDNGREVLRSSRNFGKAALGINTITRLGDESEYLPDGPWIFDNIEFEDLANDIKVTIGDEPENNRLVYEIQRCGMKITFAPYDTELRKDQITVPGLSVAVNCANHPVWLSNTDVMGLAPHWQGGSLIKEHRLLDLSDEDSMLYRAFTRDIEQNQPQGSTAVCKAVRTSLDGCPQENAVQAFKSCSWILKQPRFIKCYDDSDNPARILSLFDRCLKIQCGGETCRAVKDHITNVGCHNVERIAPLSAFIGGSLCVDRP